MPAPRFSVVIPTRERADTLQFALRTCLDQSFDDFEVIVSDNHSSPATKAVVDEAGSPKVRYVRTAEPVAMSANWEFAVGHAVGEYVVLIGDDDGLLPHALFELDRIARDTKARAIRWDAAYYTWPNVAAAGQGNYLRVPTGRGARERDGMAVVRSVARFREFYTALPMLYNAAVHRDVLSALRAKAGRVFPHPVPDVYSGFAVAAAAGSFVSVGAPMSVSGQSGASNGIATLFRRGTNTIDAEFRALNARDGLRHEPTVPDLPVFPHVPVADSFACAKRLLFPSDPAALDRRALAVACVAGARVSEADWPGALAAVRASLADDPELQAWFDAELAYTPYRSPAPMRLRPDVLGIKDGALHLDALGFGVTDVAGAARLCEQVLGYRRDGLPLVWLNSDDKPVDLELQEKEYQIHEKEAEIQAKEAEINQKEAMIHRQDAHLRQQAGQLQEKEAQINQKEAKIQELGAACASLHEQLREQSEAFSQHIGGQAAQLQAQLQERRDQQNRIAALTERLATSETDRAECAARLANAESRLEAIENAGFRWILRKFAKHTLKSVGLRRRAPRG